MYRTTTYPWIDTANSGSFLGTIKEGKSVEHAQAAGLTAEYDERWDSQRRIGSADALIEAAYEVLSP